MDEIKFNGNKLLRIRKGKDITQEKLAELVGVSRQTIYFWESNQNIPDAEKVGKLCEVLEVDLSELVDGMTNLTNSRECIKENNFYKKRINKKKIIKTVMILLLCIFIIYIITSTIKFFRLKDILNKWKIIDKSDNYYFSYIEINTDENGLFTKINQSYETYLKDGIMTMVHKDSETLETDFIMIDNYNTNERIVINEKEKTYKRDTVDIDTTSLSTHLPNSFAMNSFNTSEILYAVFNPKFIIRANGSYTIEYRSTTTVMNKETGLIFYEEDRNKNSRTQNYIKEFSIELDTNKEFVIDLNEYTEVK